MSKKVASISLQELARRADVSYPTAIKYKRTGDLDLYIVNPDEDSPRKTRFKPNGVKHLARLKLRGLAKRGRPPKIKKDNQNEQ